jgi:ring-1,2-phenylacetyl-CoA epoxidase subunit PaaC
MLLAYTLQCADNALILGHRLSEWCGHGPVLEQDIALSNMALDHLGAARSYYQLAADLYNALPLSEKQAAFSSPALNALIETGKEVDEDDLAYLRDGWDFKNTQLAEQPNQDWAYTVARSFYTDVFEYYYYQAMMSSAHPQLAAIAEKSLKEVTYHLRWSSEWVIRMGDGTEESHARIQQALIDRWAFTGELTTPSQADKWAEAAGIASPLSHIEPLWSAHVDRIIDQATLRLPADTWMMIGGKEGKHTEHLGYILAEMQHYQRTYPGMEW